MESRQARIETRLTEAVDLAHLDVLDESANHSVPDGAQSHFKVVAVSAAFEGVTRITRHRMVNELLKNEFDGGMHALALHLYTPKEWNARFGDAPLSPPCAKQSRAG